MLSVTKQFMFEACHHLPYYDGDCARQHGHSYKLEVTVEGGIELDPHNPKCGMVLDFKVLKQLVDELVVSKYDHQNLNDFFENPTAELMVVQIALDLDKRLLKEGLSLVSCRLWETTTSYAEYRLKRGE